MQYSAGIVSKSFWYLESRITVEYILKGFSDKDLVKLSLEKNIYQASSDKRARDMANILFKRFKNFPESILEFFLDVDIKSAKVFVLISIIISDKLFFEFMYEVFREHIVLGNFKLEKKDFNLFFDNKMLQSEKVANWKEYTITRLRGSYLSMLREAELLDEKNSITLPFIDLYFEELLIKYGYESFLNSIIGE